MRQRPICCLCLLMMLSIVLLKMWELPFLEKAPLSVFMESILEQDLAVQVFGSVYKRTSSENTSSVYLRNAWIMDGKEKISLGNIRVFLEEKEEPLIGADIVISGKLEKIQEPGNPGEFDSRQYYKCRHIYYQVKKGKIKKASTEYSLYGETLEKIREHLKGVLEDTAGKEAGIFCAMLLGDKGNLEPQVKTRYQMAGIIHIMAISGLHLSILGMGFFGVLKKIGLGNGAAGFLALAVIYQYGLMTGGSVSTLRAVSMMMLAIGGKILGRTYDMLTALALGAILLLLDSPDYLCDSGFLLSFGAVLGMGVVLPEVLGHFEGTRLPVQGFLASLCVQAVTLPVMLYFFYEVSVYGIFLNLLVIPTASAVLLSGVMGGILGCVWTEGAKIALLPGRILLKIYGLLCEWCCRLPFCTWVGGKPEMWQILVYYAMLWGILVLWREVDGKDVETRGAKSKGIRKRARLLVYPGMFFCLFAGVWLLGYRGKAELSVTCLDVGQGDAVVITTEDGGAYLCDGGSSSESLVGNYQIVPYLKSKGISVLNGIFVTHTDKDHISGIREILEASAQKLTSLQVRQLYLPAWGDPPEVWKELKALAERAKIPVTCLGRGDRLSGKGYVFEVLHPERGNKAEDVNESSLVLVLNTSKFRGIFTGDIGMDTEKILVPYLEKCQLLKVAHHGSANSSSTEFLEKTQPVAALISCSENNRYGHPSPEALERLERAGAKIYITKDCGAVTVTVGEQLVIERFN